MVLKTPQSLASEHQELHAELVAATRSGDKTGFAAQSVARVLHPHFLKEEEYALPPLGLLAKLARGEFPPDKESVLHMTDKLKKDLDHMHSEHKAIGIELHRLMEAAKLEKKTHSFIWLKRLCCTHRQKKKFYILPRCLLENIFDQRREIRETGCCDGHHGCSRSRWKETQSCLSLLLSSLR